MDDDVFKRMDSKTPLTVKKKYCFWRPGVLLTILSALAFVQNYLIDGITGATVSSIERRFHLTSRETGIIVSTSAISGLVVILFVSYFGGQGHKPRWLSGGAALMGIGAFLYSLPHFLADIYEVSGGSSSNLCHPSSAQTENSSATDSLENDNFFVWDLSSFIYVFLTAQVCIGMGSTPLYTLGIVTLDDNVDTQKSGLHLGIFHGVATLGPALGLIGGGAMLSLFTNIRMTDEVSITPEDPRWVGAWWLGFSCVVPPLLLISLALTLFPRELPGTEEIRRRKVSQAHVSSGEQALAVLPHFGKRPKDFFISVKYLMQNPTYVWIVISTVADLMLVVGFGTYLPKLIEIQFGQTAWFASIIVGIAVVGGGAIGTLLGGYLVKRYNWEVKQNLRFVILISICNAFLCFILLLRCNTSHVTQVVQDQHTHRDVMASDCLFNCTCSTELYEPVCTPDGTQGFFSPCHAGCRNKLLNNTYTDCSCVFNADTRTYGGTVLAGFCSSDCQMYLPFAIGLFFMMFLLFLTWMPSLQALLRCVPEQQRSLCLGLDSVFGRIFGSSPAAIIVGLIFDSSCKTWQYDASGSKGSCWIYDEASLSWKMFVLAEVLTIFATLSYGLALMMYKTDPFPERVKRLENVKPQSKDLLRGMSTTTTLEYEGV